jgi:hypothetical protein
MTTDRVVVMQRDEQSREEPASQPLSPEGAAWELVRLQASNPSRCYWTEPAPVRSRE